MSALDPELVLKAHAAICKATAGRLEIDQVDVDMDEGGRDAVACAWDAAGGGAIVVLPGDFAGVDLAVLGSQLTRLCSTSSRAAFALAGAIERMRAEMVAATEALVTDLLGDMRVQVDGLVARLSAKVDALERLAGRDGERGHG